MGSLLLQQTQRESQAGVVTQASPVRAATGRPAASAGVSSTPCIVLFETHLMSPADKASLLRRAVAAYANVIFVAPFLDAGDMDIMLEDDASGALRARVLQPSVLHATTPTRMYVTMLLCMVGCVSHCGDCCYSYHMHAASVMGHGTSSDEAASHPNVRAFILLLRALRLVLGSAVSLSMFPPKVVASAWNDVPTASLAAMHRLCDGHVDMRVLRYFVSACIDRVRAHMDTESAEESKSSPACASPRRVSVVSGGASVMSNTTASTVAEGTAVLARLRNYVDMLATLCVKYVTQRPEGAFDVPFAWYAARGGCDAVRCRRLTACARLAVVQARAMASAVPVHVATISPGVLAVFVVQRGDGGSGVHAQAGRAADRVQRAVAPPVGVLL